MLNENLTLNTVMDRQRPGRNVERSKALAAASNDGDSAMKALFIIKGRVKVDSMISPLPLLPSVNLGDR